MGDGPITQIVVLDKAAADGSLGAKELSCTLFYDFAITCLYQMKVSTPAYCSGARSTNLDIYQWQC